eukprot:TRINITY_DN4924_c0_g1_i2.p1 TRINITY_DN4924_c0_g1~~TRINITY_DN4924_c0_g1_i2.p1  ORF type:complete len:161 (-),score=15.95 TRINITY_DN4924_c0_g1_i2:29-511(-)
MEVRVLSEHRDVEHLSPTQVVYWQSSMPFPLSSRDYLYMRRGLVIGDRHLLISKHIDEHPEAPEKKGVVRVFPCHQEMVLESVDNDTRFALHYFDDLKGSIPKWLINKAAKSIVPSMIDTTHQRSQAYPSERASSLRGLHLTQHSPESESASDDEDKAED